MTLRILDRPRAILEVATRDADALAARLAAGRRRSTARWRAAHEGVLLFSPVSLAPDDARIIGERLRAICAEEANMRLFSATIATETNTFSPMPTSLAAYKECVFLRPGEHPADAPRMCTAPLLVARRRAAAEGFTLIEGSCFAASPAGTTNRADYEFMRERSLLNSRQRCRSMACCSACTAQWWRTAMMTWKATCWNAPVPSSAPTA